jgi:translocation and assembly module TamB
MDIKVNGIEIKVKRAKVIIGWRAIVEKELHFSHAEVESLEIIDQRPPGNQPFKYIQIKLPFTLRLDAATLDHLQIRVRKTVVNFYDIQLHKALWSGTELKFKDSSFNMGYLSVKQASGQMKFEQKYLLQAIGKLNIPALRALNIHDITVHAGGTLDTITAGAATHTPDLLSARMIIQPLHAHVPMWGQLNLKNYHWPLLTGKNCGQKQGLPKSMVTSQV